MALQLRKAERQRTPVRIALAGPAGAGKTWTALSMATVLAEGRRVILIDSENGRSEAYAGDFTFEVIPLPTFSPQTYLEALNMAYTENPGVVIVDSLSHAWNGQGGALEMVDAIGRKSGNKFNAWGDVTPWQNKLMNKISATPCHIIITMRAKMDHAQEKDANGKTVIRKLGMFPIQRENVDYEFDIYGMMDRDHRWTIEKSICRQVPVNEVYDEPGTEIAHTILAWWKQGKVAETPPAPSEDAPIPEIMVEPRQIAGIKKLCDSLKQPYPNFDGMSYDTARHRLVQLTEQFREQQDEKAAQHQQSQHNTAPMQEDKPVTATQLIAAFRTTHNISKEAFGYFVEHSLKLGRQNLVEIAQQIEVAEKVAQVRCINWVMQQKHAPTILQTYMMREKIANWVALWENIEAKTDDVAIALDLIKTQG